MIGRVEGSGLPATWRLRDELYSTGVDRYKAERYCAQSQDVQHVSKTH
jgi:hypothetical protein